MEMFSYLRKVSQFNCEHKYNHVIFVLNFIMFDRKFVETRTVLAKH